MEFIQKVTFGLATIGWLVAADAVRVLAAGAEVDHARSEHKIVSITDTALIPTSKRLSSSDTFGWLNYSSRKAIVSFDAETAKSMMCRTRGSFRLSGDRLEAEVEDAGFTSLCKLAPGEYRYRVALSETDEQPSSARAVLEGKLLVE